MEERIVDREARMFFVVRREVDRLIVSFFSGFERVWFSLFAATAGWVWRTFLFELELLPGTIQGNI